MANERQKGCINFICDGAGEFFEGEPGEEFGDVWTRAKAEGWIGYKRDDDGVWVHYCPDCKRKKK